MSLKERSSSLRNVPNGLDRALEDLHIFHEMEKKTKRTRVSSESGVSTFFGRIRDAVSWYPKKGKVPEISDDNHLPKRATSTPMRGNAANTEELFGADPDCSSILAESTVNVVDFAELGAFGPSKQLLNLDFDNDITAFSFFKQVCMPPIRDSWSALGGTHIYTKSILFAFDLFYDCDAPREVLHLAVYYVCSVVKRGSIVRDDLQELIVAAVRLASKVETQYGPRRRVLKGFDMRSVIAFEKKIMQILDFNLWPTTLPFFTRLLHPHICKGSWQWPFVKFASDLVVCDPELAEFKASLMAGVVMRLVSMFEGGKTWTADCYAIIQEPVENYARPHAALCRLLIAVYNRPNTFLPVSSKYSNAMNKVLPGRIGFLNAEVETGGF